MFMYLGGIYKPFSHSGHSSPLPHISNLGFIELSIGDTDTVYPLIPYFSGLENLKQPFVCSRLIDLLIKFTAAFVLCKTVLKGNVKSC